MNVRVLLGKVEEAGFRVTLSPTGPQLDREPGNDGSIPPKVLADLRENRNAVVRHLLIEAILARAGESKRRVFGFSSRDGRPTPPGAKGIPATWDRICVEGDTAWTLLPAGPTQTTGG